MVSHQRSHLKNAADLISFYFWAVKRLFCYDWAEPNDSWLDTDRRFQQKNL